MTLCRLRRFPAISLCFGLVGCAAPGDDDGGDDVAASDSGQSEAQCQELPGAETWVQGPTSEPTGESTPARIAAAGALTWPLALDLLRAVDLKTGASIANSPASMYAAMGLSYARWRPGQCSDRIAAMMRFPESDDALHNTLGASIRELQSRGVPAADGADPVVVSMMQSTWEFNAGKLPTDDGARSFYGAQVNLFSGSPAEARDVMNCTIEAQSLGLLPEFLPVGQPGADTSSYDLNVSFLQAPWVDAMFERSVDFQLEDGSTQAIPGFGSDIVGVQLYEGETFTSVEVPLRGGQLSMLAVVPEEGFDGGIMAFLDSLQPETLASARDEARDAFVDLTIPKVDIASKTLDYNDVERLDFQCEPFTLRAVLHGAAVQIDDKGIKAAAATANEGWLDGGPSAELSLTIDRPFLFFVYDHATQYVLYSGRYAG